MDTQFLAKQPAKSDSAQSSSGENQQGIGHCDQDAQVLIGSKERKKLDEKHQVTDRRIFAHLLSSFSGKKPDEL
jgi:hypothetical protein